MRPCFGLEGREGEVWGWREAEQLLIEQEARGELELEDDDFGSRELGLHTKAEDVRVDNA